MKVGINSSYPFLTPELIMDIATLNNTIYVVTGTAVRM
jgi:hypothetical protein